MKRLILITILSFPFFAYGQNAVAVQTGPVYSHIEDVDAPFSVGYFLGVHLLHNATDQVAVGGSMYFLNQRTNISETSVSVRSLNMMVSLNLFPGESGFHLIGGMELGHSLGYKVEGMDHQANVDHRYAAVVGIGYGIIDQIGMFSRYHHTLNDNGSGYQYNVQAGLNVYLFRD